MYFKLLSSFLVFLPLFSDITMDQNDKIDTKNSKQLILVKSENWESYKSEIELYEKENNQWVKVKDKIKAVIGKNGMGWGKGIHSKEDAINNTFRKEGDKRSPAGIFRMSYIFGLENINVVKKEINLKYPYIELTENTRCIGESKSKFYNEIIENNNVEKDWDNDKNNELMRYEAIRDEQAYKWGIFIDHNTSNGLYKKDNYSGSCIFIHLWKNENTPTSGCTAIDEKDIKYIISWLDFSKKPIIVQLPNQEYKRLKDKWNLP